MGKYMKRRKLRDLSGIENRNARMRGKILQNPNVTAVFLRERAHTRLLIVADLKGEKAAACKPGQKRGNQNAIKRHSLLFADKGAFRLIKNFGRESLINLFGNIGRIAKNCIERAACPKDFGKLPRKHRS